MALARRETCSSRRRTKRLAPQTSSFGLQCGSAALVKISRFRGAQMIARREAFRRTLHVALVSFLFGWFFGPAVVHAQTLAVEELQRRIDDRDKIISELVRRIE